MSYIIKDSNPGGMIIDLYVVNYTVLKVELAPRSAAIKHWCFVDEESANEFIRNLEETHPGRFAVESVESV